MASAGAAGDMGPSLLSSSTTTSNGQAVSRSVCEKFQNRDTNRSDSLKVGTQHTPTGISPTIVQLRGFPPSMPAIVSFVGRVLVKSSEKGCLCHEQQLCTMNPIRFECFEANVVHVCPSGASGEKRTSQARAFQKTWVVARIVAQVRVAETFQYRQLGASVRFSPVTRKYQKKEGDKALHVGLRLLLRRKWLPHGKSLRAAGRVQQSLGRKMTIGDGHRREQGSLERGQLGDVVESVRTKPQRIEDEAEEHRVECIARPQNDDVNDDGWNAPLRAVAQAVARDSSPTRGPQSFCAGSRARHSLSRSVASRWM
eukprot:6199679-Pleurochrysis_carterae.AAC.1